VRLTAAGLGFAVAIDYDFALCAFADFVAMALLCFEDLQNWRLRDLRF
jgi:hypothetical protein